MFIVRVQTPVAFAERVVGPVTFVMVGVPEAPKDVTEKVKVLLVAPEELVTDIGYCPNVTSWEP